MPSDETVSLWTEGVGRLTVEALEAAELGHWDQVAECYAERAKWFQHHHVSANLAQALLAMDATMMERVTLAHAAAGHALSDMRTTYRHWKSLSQTSRTEPSVGGWLNRST